MRYFKHSLGGILVSLILFGGTPAYAALTDNLVSYWGFNESSGNAADSVGSNTLTNNNTAPYVAGKIGNAVSLNGTTQYMSRANVITANTTNISMAGWVNLSGTSLKGTFWNNGNDGNGYAVGVGSGTIDSSGNELVGLANGVAWMPSGANIGAAGWHFVAVTRGATTWKFYIDNVLAGTTFTTNPGTPTAAFEVGRDNIANRFFAGNVDELGFWTRELSAAEISQLYNSGAGLAYPFTTAVPASTQICLSLYCFFQ